ncbi:acyl-CoA thioesterase [Leptothoe sp. PORK10 BA2]|uniref:acyl-CoA thioesterase n=1 Tax=Leptothoe sp. PORK10 BA2 TaxID=3110254 RepID=UPI002B205CEF|nr:acyl-CoA thioesterase [Leptothoe sp. PORK10 BA2]MEA5464091.1 acyl-CoA thioesterase [Leptothoe sp. PORK10 BA2]
MSIRDKDSGFTYCRRIRFHETDAAGVVYFANILTLCHEAYEASLAAAGIDLRAFFGGEQSGGEPGSQTDGALAVPVVHASVDFRRPLYCGDEVAIALTPQPLDSNSFEITYRLSNAVQQTVATALTRHVCIDRLNRQRHPLSPELVRWMQSATPPPGHD